MTGPTPKAPLNTTSTADMLNAGIEAEKHMQQQEGMHPDFANGRGDVPRARGAESMMDVIMSGN